MVYLTCFSIYMPCRIQKGMVTCRYIIISYPCSFGSRASSELEVYSGHKYTKSDPVLGQTKQHGYWWRFGVLSHSFQTNWKWMGRKLLWEENKCSCNKHCSHKEIWPQAYDKVWLWNPGTEFISWGKMDEAFKIYQWVLYFSYVTNWYRV